jgi:thymidylate kinase
MVTIFEGPDNSSKGTQIANLKRHYEFTQDLPSHILHYSNVQVSGKNMLEVSQTYYREMFGFCEKANEMQASLILDRAHIGESVYSPMYRNYDGDYVFRMEEKFDLSFYTLFIFIADVETLIRRDDGKSFSVDTEKKQKEIDGFKRAYDKTHIVNKHIIDITGKDIKTVWDEIKGYIK